MNLFNKDYYENGIKKKISGYENFHWIPTRSYSEAIEIVQRFDFNDCIDYGCAKGFLVHALRQLGKNAFGEDISDYAIENCDKRVKKFISKPSNKKTDLLICKDVLEHIPEENIIELLNSFKKRSNQIFLTIPLGDDNVFRIREYEIDITHITKKDEDWWLDKIRESGCKLIDFRYSMGAIKEKWTTKYTYGNGFFTLVT